MSKTETQSKALSLALLLRMQRDSASGVVTHNAASRAAAELEWLDAENKALRARLEAPAAPMADEREVFEEWARSQPMILDLTPRGDGYAGAFAQTTWMGWKARGAALAPQAAAKTGDAA